MTVLNFPSTAGKPTDGSFQYIANGVVYSWDGEKWVSNTQANGGGGGRAEPVHFDGPDAPDFDSLIAGDQWYNTNDGRLYTYTLNDNNDLVWVDASPDSSIPLWERTGTTLTPTNDGDDISVGAGTFSSKIDVGPNATSADNPILTVGNSGRRGVVTVVGPTADGAATAFQCVNGDTDTSSVSIWHDGHAIFGATGRHTAEDIISAGVTSGPTRITVGSKNLGDRQTSLFQARARTGTRTEYTAEIGLFKHSGITDPAAYTSLPSINQGRYYWTATSNNFMCSGLSDHIGTTSGTIVGTQSSDIRLKRNISDFTKGLAEVKQLEAISFEYLAEPGVAQAGFIAQQVKDIIPEAVYDTGEPVVDDEDGPTKLAMQYVKIIPALVNAIKELDAKNTALEAKVQQLEGGN